MRAPTSPWRLSNSFETIDSTFTHRFGSDQEHQSFMRSHLKSNYISLPPQSIELRARQYAELLARQERLRIDIDCIERRLHYLETTIITLREHIHVRKTGQQIMREKLQKRTEEYEKKHALLEEKYGERQALLSSICAVGQF